MPTDSLSPAAQEVYARDRERFLATLALPENQRQRLFALYAFNLEIARIPDTVSEEMIGHIRFAWWKEALDELYAGGKGRAHAIVQALKPLVEAGLPRSGFDRIIEARQRQFATPGIMTLDDFRRYAEETASALLLLCLDALGISDADDRSSAVAMGIAHAMTGHLRALAFHAQHKRVYVPDELLATYGIDKETLLSGARPDGIERLVKHMADNVAMPAIPKASRRFLKPYAVIVHHGLKQLKKAGYDPYSPRLQEGRGLLALRMLVSR